MLVPGLIIGQAVGRWGNFFNQEAFGRIVKLSTLENMHIPKFIIDGMYINGEYREPTFFYESLLCLIGFIILILVRKTKKNKTSQLSAIYLIWYGIIRLIIESFEKAPIENMISALAARPEKVIFLGDVAQMRGSVQKYKDILKKKGGTIYDTKTEELFMETGIEVSLLPIEVQAQLDFGIYFKTDVELFDFLESYSS